MASFNKIALIGNLGNDPDVREVNGKKVASFSLATNENYTNKNGEKVEKTTWFRVTFWENTANVVANYLKKGGQVYVEGRLSTSEYTDKEGNLRLALEVRGTELTLLGSRTDGGTQQNSGNTSYSNSNSTNAVSEPMTQNPDSDDLPF